jgi:hypothetical protein
LKNEDDTKFRLIKCICLSLDLARTQNGSSSPSHITLQYSYPTVPPLPNLNDKRPQEQQHEPDLASSRIPQNSEIRDIENQSLDVFYPFFDPEMLGLFPSGEMPDLSQFESPLTFDYFELER